MLQLDLVCCVCICVHAGMQMWFVLSLIMWVFSTCTFIYGIIDSDIYLLRHSLMNLLTCTLISWIDSFIDQRSVRQSLFTCASLVES